RSGVASVDKREGDFLVRNCDVAAGISTARQRSQEIGKRIRADVQPFVSAVDPELPDPVAVDEGGAGMRDWMVADEGANGLVSHRSLRGGATRRARAAWACRQS